MPADPKRVKEIFLAVSDAADDRTALLDRECGGDADLRGRVEALLHAHHDPASFLAPRPESTVVRPPLPGLQPGQTFAGRFKLREELGHGGMGVVFVADQTEPVQRRVALKVIREGTDSARLLARFEQERQALALMDHPNIAKVFDAGVSDAGQPYFVMELIKGMPITDYCDKAKLTPRERLELFVPICQAVQHAHQKGVIHRDLKPSNILVGLYDGKPIPKVIDFGVAKATGQRLSEASVYTEVGSVIGTLEYMSPEQAELNNLDIDTRSDVYALGVILYQLLTGTVPFTRKELQANGFAEMLRIIKEKEPPRPSNRLSTSQELPLVADLRRTEPSKLSQLVRGELDWIVMKALEKDRTRRYETANGLAKDVQRYLSGEAVEACPPTLAYRLRKSYRRHRAAVLTAASFAGVLLVATVVSLAFGVQARQAESRAKTQEQIAQVSATESAMNEAAAQVALKTEKAALAQLSRVDYARSIQLAYQRWNEDNYQQALQLLEGTRPEFRDWEYHYLNRLFHGERLRVKSPYRLRFAKYTPDGSQFLTGGWAEEGDDGTLILWDARTGARRKTFAREGTLNKDPKVNRAGTRILAAYHQTEKKISHLVEWDIETGEARILLNGYQGSISDASYSPDESRIVMVLGTKTFGESATVEVLDVKTRERSVLLETSDEAVYTVSYSPDGFKILITGYFRNDKGARQVHIKLVDAATRRFLTWTPEGLEELSNWGYCTAEFSPDGRQILGTVISWTDHSSVAVWDAQTGKRQITLPNEENLQRCAAFSPDGKEIVTAAWYDGLVTVWEVATAKAVKHFRGHTSSVVSAVFSPDGRQILSAGSDTTVKVWELVAGSKPIPHTKVVDTNKPAFAAHSSEIAAYTPDRKDIALYDTRTGAQIRTIHVDGEELREFALSRDGTRMATASWSKNAEGEYSCRTCIWNMTTGKLIKNWSMPGLRWPSLAFSPNGQMLAAASSEGIQIFNVKSGDLIRSLDGHRARRGSVCFSPNGRLIVASEGEKERCVRVWEVETGKELSPFKEHQKIAVEGFITQVGNAVFSPDGTKIASIGNGKTFIWDVSTREVLVTLNGFTDGNTVAFSSNGKRVITGNIRGISLWDAETGQELLSIKGRNLPPWGHEALFSPDGTLIPLVTDEGLEFLDGRPLENDAEPKR